MFLSRHATIFQVKNPIGIGNQASVMGHDQDDSPVLVGGGLEQFHYLLAVLPIKGAGRLVGKAESGRLNQSPADGHALFFTAGKLARAKMRLVCQAQNGQHFLGPPQRMSRSRMIS